MPHLHTKCWLNHIAYKYQSKEGLSVNTVKFVIMDTQLTQTFFGPDWVSINLSDNTVRTASVSTDFRLLQTSFLVPNTTTCWIQQTNWHHDHGWCIYVIMTAVLLVVTLWLWLLSCHDFVTALDTSRRDCWQDQLIPSQKTLVPVYNYPTNSISFHVVVCTSNLLPLTNRRSLPGVRVGGCVNYLVTSEAGL